GDDDDDDESSDDDEDDDDDVEEDKEEEEHPAPADFVPPPVHQIAKLIAIPLPPPSPLSPWSSPLPQIPSPPLPVSSPVHVSPPPLPASPTYLLGFRAAMIQQRAESPSTSHLLPRPPPIILSHTRASVSMMRVAAPSTYILASRSETPPSGTPPLLPIPLPTPSPPFLLPSTDHRANKPKVGESSSAPRPTEGFRADYGFVATLDTEIRRDPERDVSYEITDTSDEILKGMPGAPATDDIELGRRLTDFVTTVRHDTDEIYGRLDDAQDDKSLMSGRLTCCLEIDVLMLALVYSWRERPDFPIRLGDGRWMLVTPPVLRLMSTLQTQVTALQGQQRPASGPSQPEILEEAGTDVIGYNQCFQELALLCVRMFPKELDKIERYVGGLPDMIHRSVVASKPKIMQEAIEIATELMDKKIHTFTERQTENKRKQDDNQQQQQQNKSKTAGLHVGSGEKKPYEGSKTLCPKCNFHHDGLCAPKCHKCNRFGYLACDCRSLANTNASNN
ncbi:hypothetical protein Tco_1253665, partial [Tanacetum coccineum]